MPQKKILLISHDLTPTGAPKALLELAKLLLELEYKVYLISYRDGLLKSKFTAAGVKILCVKKRRAKYILLFRWYFNLLIYNTIECYKFVKQNTNSLWWIHEAYHLQIYLLTLKARNKKKLIAKLKKAQNIFCVSEYAKEYFNEYNSNIKILEPFVENITIKETVPINYKTNITYVGEVIPLKGQDIFIKYIKNLDTKIQADLKINFIGNYEIAPDYVEYIKQISNGLDVNFLGTLNHEILLHELNKCDIFALFSRGDSFSIATVEAMMLDKKIIISDNVGIKNIITNENCGYVINNEKDFVQKFNKLILSNDDLTSSKMAYMKYFSKEIYLTKLKNIIDSIIK